MLANLAAFTVAVTEYTLIDHRRKGREQKADTCKFSGTCITPIVERRNKAKKKHLSKEETRESIVSIVRTDLFRRK